MEKNIKDYREKELKTFVLGNILLFLVITGVINDIASLIGEDNLWKAIAELFESSILSSIVYIFVFVFDSIVQGKLKDRIIWPIKGLPGNRIFLDIAQKDKDERITKEMAQNVYKDIYEEIKTSVYKGYKQDEIEMRGDRAEMSDFPLYLNTVAGGLDRRDQTIGGFSFVGKIYAVPVVEIIG